MTRLLMMLATVGLLSACASSPNARFYTLEDSLPQTLEARSGAPSLVITRLTLPELIDRPQIVLRGPGKQVRIEEMERWAEPLRQAIPRQLAAALSQALHSSRISALPLDHRQFEADYRLQIDILRFDASPGEGAVLEMQWRVESRSSETTRNAKHLYVEKTTSSLTADLIAAQARLLQQAAQEIARQLP